LSSEQLVQLQDEIAEARERFEAAIDGMKDGFSPMALMSGKLDLSEIGAALADLLGNYDTLVNTLVDAEVERCYKAEALTHGDGS